MRQAALLLVSIALMAAASAQENSAKSQAWELKGLKLDMTPEEVLAKYPASECKTLAQGVELCIDKTATFAGGEAHLVTKFLDGQLVNVTLNRISREQAASAAQGLVAKFGSTSYTNTKLRHVGGQNDMERVSTHVWKEGDVLMFVEPVDEYVPKTRTQYSAVILMSVSRHDTAWIERATNPGVSAATDI